MTPLGGSADLPPTPGFGACAQCVFRFTGPLATCFGCASQTLVPPSFGCCDVCNQTIPAGATTCLNSLCHSPDRQFVGSAAIAMKTGALQEAIYNLKYRQRSGWGLIFARVVLGYLYDRLDWTRSFDMIIPSPTYLPPGAAASDDHTGWVIRSAAAQDEAGLPFVLDPPVIVKTAPTPKMMTLKAHERREMAKSTLLDALVVTRPNDVHGKRILVYDDVFTAGNTLNAVATKFRAAGALEVYGLALARQPWLPQITA
jgi:predicted amidophosphoribosyltransferase